MKGYTSIAPAQLDESAFRLIGTDWMLVTAGTKESFNTMTASWGGLGVLWNKNVSFIFIRPQRYTFEFVERADGYTLSFFDERHRSALQYCGAHSGREVNKVEKTGLTPVFTDSGSVGFEEARLILECGKLYWQDLDPAHFLDPDIEKNYSKGDYHRMYIGEVLSCLVKK
jgi:flavin reductase (DIM6/NTAB) family NADH-FMN oxidoreductase RutF